MDSLQAVAELLEVEPEVAHHNHGVVQGADGQRPTGRAVILALGRCGTIRVNTGQ